MYYEEMFNNMTSMTLIAVLLMTLISTITESGLLAGDPQKAT